MLAIFYTFRLHVSDPHTVTKTNLYEEDLKNSTFLPPSRAPGLISRIMHFCTKFTFYYKWFTIMYTFISFSLEFEGIIFVLLLIPFAPFFRFFLWDLSAYCIVILHLITIKRLLLERPVCPAVSQLSVVKKSLNNFELSFLVHILQLFLSKKPKICWTIFDNSVHC